MKVAVFGLGYVGITTACCIASMGHTVVGVDVNEDKVDQINTGRSPIIEPGIGELLKEAHCSGRLHTRVEAADLEDIELAIVCVGTPSASDGTHNMTYIAEVSRQIAAAIGHERISAFTVVYRSTIPPGTIEGLIIPIFAAALGASFEDRVEIVYNPEFLRESTAVKDYFEPSRIVIGTRGGQPSARLEALNCSIDAPRFHVRFGEAELTKFVDNTWHAVKVAYMNEIGRICLQLGLSAKTVHELFVADTKLNISPRYLRPGGAFGGSCLPKDIRALQHISADCGADTHLINVLLESNEAHKARLFEMATFGLPRAASVLLVGLAFKAGTDDLRESPNLDLARGLLRHGHRLSIFDPAVDADKLIGANLSYAHTQLPGLSCLLVDKSEAETGSYDRIVVMNAAVRHLDIGPERDLVDLSALA